MPKVEDPLADRFHTELEGSPETPNLETPLAPALEEEPVSEGDPPPAKETPPADDVDEKGVPLKNRLAEARRKQKAAEERAQKAEEKLEEERLHRVSTPSKEAPPPVTTPAQPFDIEALKRTPVEEWPADALRQLAKEDSSWASRVEDIMSDRIANRAAQLTTEKLSLRDRTERIDRELVSMYPDLRDKDSELYQTAAVIVREWGVNVVNKPEALRGVVREAAERLGQQPLIRSPRQVSTAPEIDERVPLTRATPRRSSIKLSAEQERMSKIFNVDPARMAEEVERTANEPLVGREM